MAFLVGDGFPMFSLVKRNFRLALGWTWLDLLPLLMLHSCSTESSVDDPTRVQRHA